MNIPIARTSLTEAEIACVLEPLRSGWLVQGPKVREFEQKWAAFTGADQAIAVTSCTTALHLSLAALGFGPGDEAIVPAFTWIATANVVEHLGAPSSSVTSTSTPSTSTRRNLKPGSPPVPRPSCPCTSSAWPPIWTPSTPLPSAMASG